MEKTDKWKMASHLHKAIRHGRPDDAEQGVRWLLDVDPAYARYRMAVIAVEDVAAGSPGLIAEAFSGGWTRAHLYTAGPDFLIEQARSWAEAVKDRTPCAWISCVRFLEPFEREHGPWPLVTLGKARRMAFDTSRPWWERGLAAWRAVGSNVFRSRALPSIPGDWDTYVYEASQLGLPEDLMACMRTGGKVQGEAHPIFLPLAGQAHQEEKVSLVSRDIPSLGYAGPWLSASLDIHTSEGKRALSDLLRSRRDWVRELSQGSSCKSVEEAVGRLWFWMEGGLLDRHLAYPTSQVIDEDTKLAIMQKLRVNPQRLFETFGHDMPSWHASRERFVAQSPRQAPPSPS